MVLSLAAAIWAGRHMFNRAIPAAQRAEAANRDARAAHQRALAAHQQALGLWSLLVFCHRRDGIYLPGGPIIPIAQMHAYLQATAH